MPGIMTSMLAYVLLRISKEHDAIVNDERMKFFAALDEDEKNLQAALNSSRDIRGEVRNAATDLARLRHQLTLSEYEIPVWNLLSDTQFLELLADWFVSGNLNEGADKRAQLIVRIQGVLSETNTPQQVRDFIAKDYLEALDKELFSRPLLAQWRHQLGLEFLCQEVARLRSLALEAAGAYSQQRQNEALERYCDAALKAWDIIDLSNMPEGDVDIATQALLLRQLYVPLRVHVESQSADFQSKRALPDFTARRAAIKQAVHSGSEVTGDDGEVQPQPVGRPVSIGDALRNSPRLVILGDPGGGKTTLLRWMATAYLMAHAKNAALTQLPDTQTLPEKPWIPVLIRCRDLGEADLCRSFGDFLNQHLQKTELLPEDADVVKKVVLSRLAKGEALLLIDGLDEISNPNVRAMFSQEVERTAAKYPLAPILVTSRIVGYRDMPHRIQAGFSHSMIADLTPSDKETFARRWIDVTESRQSKEERARHAAELIAALHSSDRIEKLTGNPMLLTTLALVKRKVGKLPNRRPRLYAEAVSVLLNWNPRLYKTIDEEEAVPQLEYVAYEMCQRGVQSLLENEVLDLLDRVRAEYPNVRAIRNHDSRTFLTLLEARSSILIRSGGHWKRKGPIESPVWEFRHLTFQEYLASRALIDGRFPGRQRAISLSQHISPIAGSVRLARSRRTSNEEHVVAESWREVLRLCAAGCKDDDVDDFILGILGEKTAPLHEARARAVLATQCLADEPNVSEAVATKVLEALAAAISRNDGLGSESLRTTLDEAAIEVAGSLWRESLRDALMREFLSRPPSTRSSPGGVWAEASGALLLQSNDSPARQMEGLVASLESSSSNERLGAALTIMHLAYAGRARVVENLIARLLNMLGGDSHSRFSAAWALGWISKLRVDGAAKPLWAPDISAVGALVEALGRTTPNESDSRHWIMACLSRTQSPPQMAQLIAAINDPSERVRNIVAKGLSGYSEEGAIAALISMLSDAAAIVRQTAINSLRQQKATAAIEPIAKLANLHDPATGDLALKALGEIGGEAAFSHLYSHLSHSAQRCRPATIAALGQLKDVRAIPILERIVDSESGKLRSKAAMALGRIGGASATATLRRLLADDRKEIRQLALGALISGMDEVDRIILSLELNGAAPWWDPRDPINQLRVTECAAAIKLPESSIRARLLDLSSKFPLIFGA